MLYKTGCATAGTGDGPTPLRSTPGGDPLPLLRRVPRAWTALSPTPAPRCRKQGFLGFPRQGPKKGFFGPFWGPTAWKGAGPAAGLGVRCVKNTAWG